MAITTYTVRTCDRCTTTHSDAPSAADGTSSEEGWGLIWVQQADGTTVIGEPNQTRGSDLCPACLAEFPTWWNQPAARATKPVTKEPAAAMPAAAPHAAPAKESRN